MTWWAALLVLAVAVSGTSAEAAPSSSVEMQSFDAFASANARCHEWSDGCVICIRRDKSFACSTPGIACTPSQIVCKPPPPAKP